jgi:RNA polymerase sigma-70 factor, ECF subfamily
MKAATESNTGQQGLNEVLEKLFEENYRMVFRAANAVLGHAEDAEDVVQQVFTSLSLRGFSPALLQNPKGYLYRAAIRRARCIVRWRGRGVDKPGGDEDPRDTSVQDYELQGRLQDALAQLRPEAAQIFILRFQEDYSDAEIASMLGKSRVMVAVSLHRSKARLRKVLDQAERKTK